MTEMARFEGVPPNMSGKKNHPFAGVHPATAFRNVAAPLLHVVVGTDADGHHPGLGSDHVLHGRKRTPAPAVRA